MAVQSIFLTRQNKLISYLREVDISAIVLNPGPSLTYLTGLHFHLMERPTIFVFTAELPPLVIIPFLEKEKIANLDYPILPFTLSDDPEMWSKVICEAMGRLKNENAIIGVEPTRLRFLEMNLLETCLTDAKFQSGEAVMARLRMYKGEDEVSAMRKAVSIAQIALEKTLLKFKLGISEKEFASELTVQLLYAGSDPELPFSPIVASGPNTANPHGSPGEKHIELGDLLLVDWGASYQGYLSDLTRTFSVGRIDPFFSPVAQAVLEANAAGRAAVHPGVSTGSVDKAARDIITTAGYGDQFFHRTGHGLGLETHEEPYIRAGNPQLLEPGMAFTIEPGIYFSGKGGIRIEDNVVVTDKGVEVLSDYPRSVTEIG